MTLKTNALSREEDGSHVRAVISTTYVPLLWLLFTAESERHQWGKAGSV